jgi:TolB-like protein
VAVLPFINMSADPEQEFFSDGISEDILDELARNAALMVRPRSSSFVFKGTDLDLPAIGRRLDVTHVLEGSVRRAGENVRITARLSEVGDNRTVWSGRYDRELGDLFAVQDEVVGEILSALNVQLRRSGQRYVPGIDAYEAFLLGRHLFSRSQFDLSDKWLETAVGLDPAYAEAWACFAENIAWRTAIGAHPSVGEIQSRRRQYIGKALEIDPTNATALGTQALTETLYARRDFERAANDLIDLVARYPNNTTAHFFLCLALGAMGRWKSAARIGERLATLAPGSMIEQSAYVTTLLDEPDLDLASRKVEEFSARFDYPLPRLYLAMLKGDLPQLQDALGDARKSFPAFSVYFASLVPYMRGDYDAARQVVAPLKLSKQYQPFVVKCRFALVERGLDAAFDYYYRAVEAAEPESISGIQGHRAHRSVFPEFFADPRYARMLEDFNVDPASVAKMVIKELPL